MSAPVSVRVDCPRGHHLPGASLTVRDEGEGRAPSVREGGGLLYLTDYPGGASRRDPGTATVAAAYRETARYAVTCPRCGAVGTIWRDALHRRAVEATRAGRRWLRLP